jgi:O-antigen ligase
MIDTNGAKPKREAQPLSWRGQWLGWLGLASLVSFTWLPYSYYLMVSFPWIVLWQGGFFLLAVWAIWMLNQSRLPFERLGYGLDWGMGLLLIALIASALMAQFKAIAAWNASVALCYGVLLYTLRNWLGKGAFSVTRLWAGLCGMGVVASAISLITWRLNFIPSDPTNGWPLGHPNFVAGYLLLVLPLTFFWALSHQGGQKVAGLAATGLMVGVLYTTSSRGGFVGLLGALLVGAGFWIAQGRGKQRSRRMVAVAVGVAIAIALALSNPRVQQIVQVASPQGNAPAIQVRADSETMDRLLMWRGSLDIVKTHPLLGVGPGNMSRVYDLYRPVVAGLSMNHLQQLHSTPIQIVGELGLLGLSGAGALLGCIGVLWYRLYRSLSEVRLRYLLYGIGSALLAYLFSTFTDYQLENIGISSTLVALIALLIGLADIHSFSPPTPLRQDRRRWLSLGGLVAIALVLILWSRVTAAMWLSTEAQRNFQAGNVSQAYNAAAQAADLAPWDPTYNLLAALQTLRIRDTVRESKLFQDLTGVALDHAQKVVAAAPNDAPFNQLLGMLYHDRGDRDRAALYLGRAVQLFPRSPLYTYYLLGREYLQQQQTEKAVTAFALEGLINPRLLLSPIWQQPPLSPVREAVAQKNLSLLSLLLEQIGKDGVGYNQIYDQFVLLSWWYQRPINQIDTQPLSLMTQALLAIEKSPEFALKLLDRGLQQSSDPEPFLLLRGWINPVQYFTDYLKTNEAANMSEQERQLLEKSLFRDRAPRAARGNRDIRAWIASLGQRQRYASKKGLILTYRNYQGKNIGYIPLPPEIETSLIASLLNLFPQVSPVLPPLDRLVDRVRTEQLNLPHPTASNL